MSYDSIKREIDENIFNWELKELDVFKFRNS